MSKEVRFAGFVLAFLLVTLCVLMNQNTDAVQVSNDLRRADQEIQLRSEYERVLLGCAAIGASTTEDIWVRQLCDEELVVLREKTVRLAAD